jgi:hypothetical protein
MLHNRGGSYECGLSSSNTLLHGISSEAYRVAELHFRMIMPRFVRRVVNQLNQTLKISFESEAEDFIWIEGYGRAVPIVFNYWAVTRKKLRSSSQMEFVQEEIQEEIDGHTRHVEDTQQYAYY